MAVPSGVRGGMTVAGHSFRFAEFSLNFVQDVHDTTGFASTPPATWRTSVAGLRVATITASGYFEDNADPNLVFEAANDQTGVSFTGTVDTGKTYTGTLILETATLADGVNGIPVISITGRSTGPVVESTGGST